MDVISLVVYFNKLDGSTPKVIIVYNVDRASLEV